MNPGDKLPDTQLKHIGDTCKGYMEWTHLLQRWTSEEQVAAAVLTPSQAGVFCLRGGGVPVPGLSSAPWASLCSLVFSAAP